MKSAELDQAKLELKALENACISLREKLNIFMGLANEELNWRAEEELEEELPPQSEVQEFEKLAKSQRLDLLAAQKETHLIASLGAQKKWWTYTNGRIGLSTEREAEGFQETGPTLSLLLPFFNYGQADRARLYAMWLQSCEKLKALNIRIEAEVREAEKKLLKNEEIAKNYRIILLPLLRRILNTSLLQYNAMAYSVYALIDHKKQMIRTQMLYQSALKDYWTAHAEWMRAVGGK